MGGGDLNLKKSWHPGLMKNQERVWKEEKKALAERKKVEELRREREEEAAYERLQALDAASGKGGPRVDARVQWMYQGPTNGNPGTTEETEAFLLGKRRIDTLLKTEDKPVEKTAEGPGPYQALQEAVTARDTASKVRADPMMAIRKSEQEAIERILKDPSKREMLLKEKSKSHRDDRDRDDRRHRHSRSHRDDRRERDERRSHRDRQVYHDHRQYADDISDEESDSARRRHRRTDSHRHHHRRRGDSVSRSRSPPPSSRRRYEDSSRPARRERSPRTSPNQSRRSRSPSGRRNYARERSPIDRPSRFDDHHKTRRSLSPRRNGNVYIDRGQDSTDHRRDQMADNKDAERARKLAEMQANASSMAESRQKRVENADAQDRAERDEDEKMRSDKGKFVSGLHRQRQGLDLADSLRRNAGHRAGGIEV